MYSGTRSTSLRPISVDLTKRIVKVIQILEHAVQNMTPTLIDQIIDLYGRDHFLILIACLLSLRARDSVTIHICKELFARAKTPHELINFPLEELEKIIKPINYSYKKARIIKSVSQEILEKYNNIVPSTYEQLISIKGVGPKTANLVLSQAFNIPAICVDTHVHRISNRLGWVSTKTPEETQVALEKIVPRHLWNKLNPLLVVWGQNICVPLSPKCSECIISNLCPKINVTKHR